MHLLSRVAACCSAAYHHPVAVHLGHHRETVANVALISATAVHEYGNAVGLACIPLLAVLLANLLLPLLNHN